MGAATTLDQVSADKAQVLTLTSQLESVQADEVTQLANLAVELDVTKKYVYGSTLLTFDANSNPIFEAINVIVADPAPVAVAEVEPSDVAAATTDATEDAPAEAAQA